MPQVLSVLRKRPRASRGMLLPVSTPHGSAAGRASSVHSLGGGRASGSPQGGVSDAQQVSANSNLSPVLSLGSAEGHSRGSEHTEAGRHLFGAYGRQRVVQVFSTGQPQLPTCHRPPKTPPVVRELGRAFSQSHWDGASRFHQNSAGSNLAMLGEGSTKKR